MLRTMNEEPVGFVVGLSTFSGVRNQKLAVSKLKKCGTVSTTGEREMADVEPWGYLQKVQREGFKTNRL